MEYKLSSKEKKIFQIIQSLPEFEKKLKNGRKTLRLLEKYTAALEATEKKLSRGDTGLQAQLQQASNLKVQVQNIYNEAASCLSEITTILSNIKTENATLRNSIEEVNETIAEVNNVENGIKAQLDVAKKDKSSVRAVLMAVENEQSEIETKVETIEGKIQEMATLYEEFLETKSKIDDPVTGLAQILTESGANKDEIVAVKQKADTLYASILKTRDESVAFLKDIKKVKEEAELNRDNILAFAQESEENNQKIAEIYEIATGRGLAGSFDKRKNELQQIVIFWGIILAVGLVAYVGVLIWIYHETFLRSNNPTIDIAAWYRFTLTSPLLFLIGFASFQYSRERGLLEKYSFKSATALALEAYTRLLTEKFYKFEEEIIKFVLNAMTMIYKEPHEKEKVYKFNVGMNKIFNVSVEEKEQAEVSELFERKADTSSIENLKKVSTPVKPSVKLSA